MAFLLLERDEYSLNTVRADGTEGRTSLGRLTDLPTYSLPLLPPVPSWSPNGDLLAFATVTENEESVTESTIYTARPDGTETALLVIPGNVSHVLWSPTGEYLAMVSWVWKGFLDSAVSVYFANADGTLVGRIPLARPLEPWHLPRVSWSPTRPELLVVDVGSNHVFLFQLEGDTLSKLDLLTSFFYHPNVGRYDADVHAAWSPDGERIALHVWDYTIRRSDEGEPFHLFTLARDGTDRRDLVTLDDDGNLVPASSPEDE